MRNKLSIISSEIKDYLEGYCYTSVNSKDYFETDGKKINRISINLESPHGTVRITHKNLVNVVVPGYLEINYNIQPEEWTYLLKNLYILNDFNMNYNFSAGIEYNTDDDTYSIVIKNIEEIQ